MFVRAISARTVVAKLAHDLGVDEHALVALLALREEAALVNRVVVLALLGRLVAVREVATAHSLLASSKSSWHALLRYIHRRTMSQSRWVRVLRFCHGCSLDWSTFLLLESWGSRFRLLRSWLSACNSTAL